MSANRIAVLNSRLNVHRTSQDRAAYRAKMRSFTDRINAAQTDDERTSIWRERDEWAALAGYKAST